MNCLLITKPENRTDLVSFLRSNGVEYDTTDDELLGIQKAHENRYDVVVMDAGDNHLIDRTIRILKECNPAIRIIVRTDLNSRELETLVRKESIFYYHLNSFGIQEVTSALGAALELNEIV